MDVVMRVLGSECMSARMYKTRDSKPDHHRHHRTHHTIFGYEGEGGVLGRCGVGHY